MDLKAKLKYYDPEKKEVLQKEEKRVLREVPAHWQQLAEISSGGIYVEKDGYFYHKFSTYDSAEFKPLKELSENNLLLSKIEDLSPGAIPEGTKFNDILFFDIETSGLAGGAGTSAFMIGAAYYDGANIRVHQWVMPDFAFESIMLEKFNILLDKFQVVASFNGKSFDATILRNRFILNKILMKLDGKPHWDLLYPSRRLWSNRLGSCRLQNLEREILRQSRHDDIPGEMIPSVYFSFLYGRQIEEFNKIIEHNYWDLVNLIKIAAMLEYLLQKPEYRIADNADFLSYVNYLAKNKKIEYAIETIREREKREGADFNLTQLHAELLRKSGRYNEAGELYAKLVENGRDDFSLIENYAKILEHNIKNFDLAIHLLEKKVKSMEILEELHGQLKYSKLSDLKYRLNRIYKKRNL